MELETALQKYFGHSHFRSGQKQIVESVLSGHDTLVVLATGGGKSICFQLPGLLLGGPTLVVSPLISLIEDQVQALRKKNISAVAITSNLTPVEKNTTYKKILNKEYQFIYVSPERLKENAFCDVIKNCTIKLVAIDEAHCISEWGHDFRPSYKIIASFCEKYAPQSTKIAVTATATQPVQKEICQLLQLSNPSIFLTSFLRNNLFLKVQHCTNANQQLCHLLKLVLATKNSSIIYAATREKVVSWTQTLNYLSGKTLARAYHGALSREKKKSAQEEFFSGRCKNMVATSAFGMGIDKADIGNVIHLDPALTLEEYYQEVGRAGRNGEQAECVLLANPASTKILNYLISSKEPEAHRNAARKLETMFEYVTTKKCRHSYIMDYFGEKIEICPGCDNCFQEKRTLRTIALTSPIVGKMKEISQHQIFDFLTPTQLKLLELLQPRTSEEFRRIPGIGLGWTDTYFESLSPHLEEIYADTEMVQ